MSIDDLPEEALQLLATKPKALGSKALEPMAAAAKQGRSAQVIETIRLVIEKKIDQQQAIEMIKVASPPAEKKKLPTTKLTPVNYMVGRSTYCSYIRSNKRIAINFKSADDAAEVEAAIKEVLNAQAERRNLKKK